MIKKLFLFSIICLCSLSVFAQKADTVRRKVGGTVMLSTNDFMQNLSQAKQFSIFVSLVDKAGLTDSLKSAGPITVFAPNNKAFEAKGTTWLEDLEKSNNKKALQMMVMSHIFKGAITSKQIEQQIQQNKGAAMLNSVNGEVWSAKIDSNRNIQILYHNGQGNNVVSKFDIPQKNGILFTIKNVLTLQPGN